MIYLMINFKYLKGKLHNNEKLFMIINCINDNFPMSKNIVNSGMFLIVIENAVTIKIGKRIIYESFKKKGTAN